MPKPTPSSQHKTYQRMAAAIALLRTHFRAQPSVGALAQQLQISPDHLHRLFKQWVGVTPKQFLQYVTVENAKPLLQQQNSCIETSLALGLSGSSRLHDHLVTLEAVTPGDIKTCGAGLCFFYGNGITPLGNAKICWTERGIHSLKFLAGESFALDDARLRAQWSAARWQENHAIAQQKLDQLFSPPTSPKQPLSLCVSGTNFQIAVWRALLDIPYGCTQSYGELAKNVGNPKANRAVGTAVGKNPIAVFIPCHRVIRDNGALGGYRWGLETKSLLLAKELLLEKPQ